jgi:DNA-binding transcriptional ArsR family regulator
MPSGEGENEAIFKYYLISTLTGRLFRYIIIINNDNITEISRLTLNKADLILHPARLQILQALALKPMNTQELAENLSGVPKSSIYRHMRALLDGGMVEIAETRPVKGVMEKFYRLAQNPHLSQADVASYTPEQNLRYFAMFLAEQLQGFAGYLSTHPQQDFQSDRVGYTELNFYASPAELDQLQAALSQVLRELAPNPPAAERHRHKFAIITYPLPMGEIKNEPE